MAMKHLITDKAAGLLHTVTVHSSSKTSTEEVKWVGEPEFLFTEVLVNIRLSPCISSLGSSYSTEGVDGRAGDTDISSFFLLNKRRLEIPVIYLFIYYPPLFH